MSHAEFSSALLDPLAPVPTDVRVRTGASRSQRFSVYRNNVIVALIDGLSNSFPVTCALVGQEFFRGMAREFARRYPPSSPVMAEYGAAFPGFVDAFAPAQSLPYLGDVARLEWQYVVSFHAADADSLTSEQVAARVADQTSLAISRWRLHPSLGLVESHYAIVSLWQAHQSNSPSEVVASLARLEPLQAEAAMVMRQGLVVKVIGLTHAQVAFIRALSVGAELAVAVADARYAAAEFDLTLAFAMLLRNGALVDCSISPDSG